MRSIGGIRVEVTAHHCPLILVNVCGTGPEFCRTTGGEGSCCSACLEVLSLFWALSLSGILPQGFVEEWPRSMAGLQLAEAQPKRITQDLTD